MRPRESDSDLVGIVERQCLMEGASFGLGTEPVLVREVVGENALKTNAVLRFWRLSCESVPVFVRMDGMENASEWYAVKCLLEHPTRAREGEEHLYEERITVWRACSYGETFEQAEVEARRYASEAKALFVAVSDGFRLFDEEIKGATEVYSAMRGSNMPADVYLKTFCCTANDVVESRGGSEERN